MKCVVIEPEAIRTVDWTEGDESADWLHTTIGGWFQMLRLTDNALLWCDDDGKLKHLPVNVMATRIYEQAFGPHDIIVGTVVITGGVDDEGYTLGLTDADAAVITRIALGEPITLP